MHDVRIAVMKKKRLLSVYKCSYLFLASSVFFFGTFSLLSYDWFIVESVSSRCSAPAVTLYEAPMKQSLILACS